MSKLTIDLSGKLIGFMAAAAATLILVAASAAQAEFDSNWGEEINIATVSGATISGSVAGENLGVASAALDLNNDGFDDLVIGATPESAVVSQPVKIIFGGASGITGAVSPKATIVPPSGANMFGIQVINAGDVNKDAIDDLLIVHRSGNGGKGAAYLFFGKYQDDNSSSKKWVTGMQASSADVVLNSSTCISSASGNGDVNGDGIDDLVFSCSTENSFTGAARVVYGRTTWSKSFDLANGVVLTGGMASEYAGRTVAIIADVNQDNLAEILVAAPGYSSPGMLGNGRVYLVLGSRNFSNGMNLADSDWIFNGDQSGITLGSALAGIGDFNRDGINDFAVGASNYDAPEGGNTGAVYLFFGKKAALPSLIPSMVLQGDAPEGKFGYRIAAGDVNGDGASDLLVGAPYHSGLIQIKMGRGKVLLFLGRTNPSLGLTTYSWVGNSHADSFGTSLAVGDFDKNGSEDLALGSPVATSNSLAKNGRVYVMQTPAPEISQLLGDVDNDGWVGNVDALAVQLYCAVSSQREAIAAMPYFLDRADYNRDGTIDCRDACEINAKAIEMEFDNVAIQECIDDHLNALNPDVDGDGLSNSDELRLGFDPFVADYTPPPVTASDLGKAKLRVYKLAAGKKKFVARIAAGDLVDKVALKVRTKGKRRTLGMTEVRPGVFKAVSKTPWNAKSTAVLVVKTVDGQTLPLRVR